MFSGTSNPLATTEEIQKRLVRPSSSSSSSHRSSTTPFSTIRSQNRGDPMKTRKVNMNKLEDYLDPILLSAIRSKMKNIDRRGEEKEVKSRVSRGFEWPSTELNFFMEDSDFDDSRVVKRRKKLISDGVVNLRNDLDGEIVPVEEEHEEEQVEGCSPFGRFEITVSKLFGN